MANEGSNRFLEVGQLLAHIRTLEPQALTFSQQFRLLKGLFFVQLYAAYEYTVGSTVDSALGAIRDTGTKVKDLRFPLLALELDGHFRSVMGTSRIVHWNKRLELVERIGSTDASSLSSSPLGPVLMNPDVSVLHAIWRLFCINDVLFKEPRWQGRVTELVENRNKVAHGRESASTVGGGFSVQGLDERYQDINAFCLHFSSSLSGCVSAALHVRPAVGA